MPRFSLSSLRVRLLLLVALAIVPAGGVILYAGREERDQATLRAQADVQRLAHRAAAEEGPLIEGARELLHTLVVLPQVQHGDARACNALLGDLLAQSPQYANLGVSRANGDVFCSALALPGPVTIADQGYFHQARADRTFAVGSYQIGRITGRAGLNFGMPVLTPAGTVAGVAFASLDLAWLNALAAQLELPPGATLTILDRQGVILARRPDPGLWMGRSLSDATLLRVILARRKGVGAATDLDGTPSLVAFAPLGAPAAPSEVFVSIGVPQAGVVAAANRLLHRSLIWLGVVAVLALAVAWGGGDLFLLRQVQALLAAARRLAAGDLRARSGLPAGSGELPQLARAFDDMAEALERRIAGQEQAEGQLRRANRALRVLSECNQRMVRATTEAALLEAVCRILVETGGYRMAWVGVAEKDATKRVRPVAQFGDAEGYLAAVTISWADTDLGRGPIGTAIRTGAPSVAREILTDPRLAPWRAEALRRGYASLIVFPLTVDGAPWGALTIYAAEPDAFNTEEETLLVELADDLAYGIEALRTRKAHERALADIASLARFPGQDPNPILRVREDGTILYANEPSGPLLRLWGTATGGPVPPEWGARVRRALETHAQEAIDLPCDGRIFGIVLAPIVEARYVNLYGRDVTERRRAEEALLARTRQLEAVRAVTAELTRELDLPVLLDLILHRTMELLGTQGGTVFLWDGEAQVLVPATWLGFDERRRADRLRLGEGVAGTAAERRAGMMVNDFRTSPYARPTVLARTQIVAVLAEPLLYRERLVGVILVSRETGQPAFVEEELKLLALFAPPAATAIENARLYELARRHAAELEVRVQERTQQLAAANQQLQDASRHKSEFLANMSHELRTPLNSIIGFAELLREQGVGPLTERQARYLSHTWNAGKHLLQLIGDILDLSKVEAGRFILQPEPLPVAQTLQDILVIARGLANKKEQEIQTDIEPDLPPLTADPVRFKQILFNLLSNAVKFTPEKGTITVTARQVTDDRRPETDPVPRPPSPVSGLEIRVTDTGIGIKPEDLPCLFQEFVQLERTQKVRQEEGTGLGLALTKRLVELHGGQVWAESQGEGRGSTFTVLLPFG